MKKEFDFDAFNKTLQNSTNICAGARADIERAIKAGKGENISPVKEGQIWRRRGYTTDQYHLAARLSGRTFFVSLLTSNWVDHGDWTRCIDAAGLEYVADNLKDFLTQGLKL